MSGSRPYQTRGRSKITKKMEEEIEYQDWWAVPTPLLAHLFRTVVEQHDSPEAIAQAWCNLALVCKAWYEAAISVPLCFHLCEPAHVASAPSNWMASKKLQVVILSRSLSGQHQTQQAEAGTATQFDLQLMANPRTITQSASSLNAAINFSLRAAPLLRPFVELRQVALFTPLFDVGVPNEGPVDVDLEALRSLSALTCLSLSGYMVTPNWEALPSTLKHLSVSIHSRYLAVSEQEHRRVNQVVLPPEISALDFICLKADGLAVDWKDLTTRCQEIHLSANFLAFITGSTGTATEFADLVVAAPRAECAVLAFHDTALYPNRENVPPLLLNGLDDAVLLDTFLLEVRQRALSLWDLDPVMDAPPNFVSDHEPYEECFCLTMEKQEGPEPRSYHFTTPISDAEIDLLVAHPAWRLVWCPDPRTIDILRNPAFLAANSQTLARLSRCTLPEGLPIDLTPYVALRSLHCTLPPTRSIRSIRFPSHLTSLEIEVPPRQPDDEGDMLDPEGGLRFDAACITALTSLRDLALTGWARHDLSELSSSVTSLRIMNPDVEYPESLDASRMRFPTALAPDDGPGPSGADGRGRSRSTAARLLSYIMPGHAQEDEPYDWDADMEDDPGVEYAFEAEDAALEEGDANNDLGGNGGDEAEGLPAGRPRRRRRRRMPHNENGLDEDAPFAFTSSGHDDDMYDDGWGGFDEEGEVANGGHGASCGDPHCPVHSGKPHLQLTFADSRDQIVVDLGWLLQSKFPMMSIALDPTVEAAQHGVYVQLQVGEWDDFLTILRESQVEVLEINHHRHGGIFINKSPLGNSDRHHYLWEGLKALETAIGGEHYEFRTWDGQVSRVGLVKEGVCYALVRKKDKRAGTSAEEETGHR